MTKETIHVKLRTRVLAAASTLAVVGGLLGAMAPAASAATVLESCNANLLSTITPPLGATLQSSTIKGSDKTNQTCTGALSAISGNAIANSVGVTGVGSCPALAADPPLAGAYPFNGKMSIKYFNLDPNSKNYASSAYIRLGSSETALNVLSI